jgi:hypothetical protein
MKMIPMVVSSVNKAQAVITYLAASSENVRFRLPDKSNGGLEIPASSGATVAMAISSFVVR